MSWLDEIYGNGIPEGEFAAVIEGVESADSKSGKPRLAISVRLADGPAAGRHITEYRSLQPQALFRLAKDLIALGAGSAELPEGESARAETMAELTKQLEGAGVRVRVKREGDSIECIF